MKNPKAVLCTVLFLCSTFAHTFSSQVAQAQKNEIVQKSESSGAEKLQIAVQKICPVSGQNLGSMGEPVKIQAGEQIAYLCCKGCQGKKISAKHWATIQTRIAKAQGTCPIMGKEVDATMKSTVVDGQQIFVCCPPCIPKIQADSKTAIAKINESYGKFVAAERQAESDKLHIKAQGICPVTGQKLGSMGKPVKVKVGEEEHVFLCCQGCVGKKIDAKHWKTIQTNLANAQGICPVMDEPVDATMKSVVVKGRKIFVCCPPCIKKIKEKPDQYVKWLDEQIANGGKPKSSDDGGKTDSGDHSDDK